MKANQGVRITELPKSTSSQSSALQLYSDPRLKVRQSSRETRARRRERISSGIRRGAVPPGIKTDWDEMKQRSKVRTALAVAKPKPSQVLPPKGLPEPPGLTHPIRSLFDKVDADGDGFINVREMVIGLRSLPEFGELMGLPQRVVQEDGTRDAMVAIFQDIDKNNDRDISWEEFLEWFLESRAKLSNAWQTFVSSS